MVFVLLLLLCSVASVMPFCFYYALLFLLRPFISVMPLRLSFCPVARRCAKYIRAHIGGSEGAVLVAIAIPVFTSQLEKSREATDMANVRSAYAEVVTTYLAEGSASPITVSAQQTVSSWQTSPQPVLTYQGGDGSQSTYSFDAGTSGYQVGISVDSSTGAATPSVSAS